MVKQNHLLNQFYMLRLNFICFFFFVQYFLNNEILHNIESNAL